MTEISNNKNLQNDYEGIIASYSDEELRKVLKKRKHYRKDAAAFAVQEAIRRGIIYSEQDLFAREYQDEPEKFSIFPTVENSTAKQKYIKSIIRTFIVIGVVPLVYGGVRAFETWSIEAVLMFVFGGVWIVAALQLKKTLNIKTVYFLLFLMLVVISYLVRVFIVQQYIYSVDVLFSVIAVGIVLYLAGFLRKLID
jgi:hypothetical protein